MQMSYVAIVRGLLFFNRGTSHHVSGTARTRRVTSLAGGKTGEKEDCASSCGQISFPLKRSPGKPARDLSLNSYPVRAGTSRNF